ncbi:MAG: DNA polymerase III subunit gamma/tau [Candidatus Levyibacteriota bacterium]
MVYYRKYRPQLISELDLVAVRGKLTAILSSKNIPHAFLFAGPKGLGKTSGARILAKAINCEKKDRKSIEPCNVCSSCISITNGSAVDVLEIDAASNRGIDEIRDLRERIKFSPSQLRKKVYIIDEVHMLTTEAFNALLKTLEEPPSHVLFILATTEMGKLPATILSRTFLVRFEKPTAEELARSLSRVVEGEKLEVEEGVLSKIAELSDRAFRDAVKILEELSLHARGKKITLEILESLYRAGSTDNSVDKLLDFTLEKQTNEALKVIDSLASQNADFKLIIEKMANVLHGKLLDFTSKGNINGAADEKKLLSLLDEAYKNLKGAVLPQLPLEIAVIEYCIEEVPGSPRNSSGQDPRESSGQARSETSTVPSSATRNDGNSNLELFRKLVEAVNHENKILAGLLRGCKLEEKENGKIVILASSKFHFARLSEQRATLEQKLDSLLDKKNILEIVQN